MTNQTPTQKYTFTAYGEKFGTVVTSPPLECEGQLAALEGLQAFIVGLNEYARDPQSIYYPETFSIEKYTIRAVK